MCHSKKKRQPSEPEIDSWLQVPDAFQAFQAYHTKLKETYVIRSIIYSFREIIQSHHIDVASEGREVMLSKIELMTPPGVPSMYTWQPRNNEGNIRDLEISQFIRFKEE